MFLRSLIQKPNTIPLLSGIKNNVVKNITTDLKKIQKLYFQIPEAFIVKNITVVSLELKTISQILRSSTDYNSLND